MLLNQLIENVFTNHPTFANQENFIEHPSEKNIKQPTSAGINGLSSLPDRQLQAGNSDC